MSRPVTFTLYLFRTFFRPTRLLVAAFEHHREAVPDVLLLSVQ